MIQLKAWAKINIGLKILNKREDGFHNIETTLSTVNLADFITLQKTDTKIELEAQGCDFPIEDNLCYRAADFFRGKYDIKSGVKISLVKNIPIGGGLGGGSSDAACVLKGMRKLFERDISDDELMNVAGQIGSDVPFFIKGGAAYARGRGDELKFFKLPRMSLVLYCPGYPISTKWAYEEYDKLILTPMTETDTIKPKEKKKLKMGFQLENSFERVVFKKHPDLLDVKVGLLSTGTLMVLLSGSGSCLFTLVDESIRKKIIKYLEGIGAQFFEVSTI
jgi:4-diphosphocytidyl-2-C-methyl-D-erythritol kinase